MKEITRACYMNDLDRLFYWRGIAPDFYNYRGEHTTVSLENRIQLLKAMGVDTDSSESIAKSLFDLDTKPWLSWLPPLEVVQLSNCAIQINVSPEELNDTFYWSLKSETEIIRSSTFIPSSLLEVGDYTYEGRRYSRREIPLSDISLGYYSIEIQNKERTLTTLLAIAPDEAYLPNWVNESSCSPWGFVVQLYTLRSSDNWGIGDFSDLQHLLKSASTYGVDIIGLNPFHSLQPDLRSSYSPYAPSDRRFLNPLYIDVEAAPGYDIELRPSKSIELARSQEHVDYHAIREVKYSVLFACFERFLLTYPSELGLYIKNFNADLVDFANFEALSCWQPDDLVVQRSTKKELIEYLLNDRVALPVHLQLTAFYCYLQWVAETQLKVCQDIASNLGMKVGLVRDLAVGASGSGSEIQTSGSLFCHDASIGAPPDPLALTGQNWGIPPMDPAKLRQTGFSHFITLLRSNMSHCGALRIDHAMSLFRLWWCPPGKGADEGAYIYYPFRELLGLLCLESHLNKCVVIAEDLGIVPDEFRAGMERTGLYSNRLFYFEKWNDSEFKHPHQHPRHALAMLDNHDVPTLTSWWNGTDITLRDELGLLGEGTNVSDLKGGRLNEKRSLLNLLRESSMLPDEWENKGADEHIDFVLLQSIIRFVSQSNSQFFILQLEDLLMMDAPVNVPGTHLEHKNWSRKLNTELNDIFASPKIDAVLKAVAAMRNT